MNENPPSECVEPKVFEFGHAPNELVLESGERIGPVQLAYETYGELNEAKTNGILIAHALSGDAHVAGRHHPDDAKPGWWDDMVGPGKAFDTSKYFIICSNVLGGCGGSSGPSSLDPSKGEPYGLAFPVITIGDMVNAQKELVAHLGIDQLLCIGGGSMGGMQTLEWMTRYPDAMRCAMVIASTHISGAQQIAFDAVGRNAIQGDSAFNGGDYYDSDGPAAGLSVARMLAHITYLSDESMRAKFGRTLRNAKVFNYDFASEFSVETYLSYQGEQFVDRFDANSYLYITKAMDYFDLSAAHESLDDALAEVTCKTLVLSYTSDWLYPPHFSEDIVYALARLGNDVSYCNIESDYGHDAFILEIDVMSDMVRGFLAHALNPESVDTTESTREKTDKAAVWSRPDHDHRVDLDTIVDLVDPHTRVLDVGCADGELLARLIQEKQVTGTGFELFQNDVERAIARGVSVIQGDIDGGLSAFPDQYFDYVTLSMTFQVVEAPRLVLHELLRVSNRCILSFPNFGHWSVRSDVFFGGVSPITRGLPFSWEDTPNRHFFSIKDFRRFCVENNVRIEREIPLGAPANTTLWPNCLAKDVIYVLGGE